MLKITTLHAGKPATKTMSLSAAGQVSTIKPYPRVTLWTRQVREVRRDVDALREFLQGLPAECCIVTGEPCGPIPLKKPARRLKHAVGDHPETLAECQEAWLPIDVDKFELSAPLDHLDPAPSVAEAVERLGEPFASTSYVWSLTSSAQPGACVLSVRLFFLVDRAISNDERKRWADELNRAIGVKLVDTAIYNAAQPIYTAAPIFVGGRDPFPTRWGVTYGELEVLPWDRVAISENAAQAAYRGAVSRAVHGSVAEILASIGDHPGGQGFHEPIRQAVFEMVRHRWLPERIIGTIRDWALNADMSRHDRRYVEAEVSEQAIRRSIAGADRRLQIAALPLRKTQTRRVENAMSLDDGRRAVRDAVELWAAGKTKRVLVVRATVGVGKTHAAVQGLVGELSAGKTLLWGAPNHRQGEDVVEAFRSAGVGAIRIEGRVREGAEPLCSRPQLVTQIQKAGLARFTATIACRRPDDETVCPHIKNCAYYRQFLGDEQVRVVPHEVLTLPKARARDTTFMKGAIGVVIDESCLSTVIGHRHLPLGQVLAEGGELAMALLTLRNGGELSADTVPALEAEMKARCVPPDFVHGPNNEAGLMAELAHEAKKERKPLLGLYRAVMRVAEGHRNLLWFSETQDGPAVFYAWRKELPEQRTLVLDATADEAIYRALFGDDVEFIDIDVEQHIDVIQVYDSPCSKREMLDESGRLLARAVAFARSAGAPLIAYKVGIERATELGWLPKDYPTAHFGALRGLNHLRHADSIVIAGRPQPKPLEVEALARALWPTEALSLGGGYQWVQDGAVSVHAHPDQRVDAILRVTREAEIEQAIGRLRAVIGSRRRTVYLLTATPVEHPAEVVGLDDLLPPWQLARMLLAGNGAAPLNPAWMAATLPDVWGTQKGAKRWLEKAPISLISNISLRKEGLLNAALLEGTYRAQKQRRASRFLSWHKSADETRQVLQALVGEVASLELATSVADNAPAPFEPDVPALQQAPAVDPFMAAMLEIESNDDWRRPFNEVAPAMLDDIEDLWPLWMADGNFESISLAA